MIKIKNQNPIYYCGPIIQKKQNFLYVMNQNRHPIKTSPIQVSNNKLPTVNLNSYLRHVLAETDMLVNKRATRDQVILVKNPAFF